MGDVESEDEDYTRVTISTIIGVSILILLYLLFSDLTQNVAERADSFSSSSWLIFLYRFVCFIVCGYAIVYMFRCGPGNMHVVNLKDNSDVLLHPLGKEKFVTFSSWTLLACTGYFLLSLVSQIQSSLNFNQTSWLPSLQTALFCIGISMAFQTATVVRYIILPNMVKNNNSHNHMFLYHEQIMHNFTAIFLMFEMLMVQPNLSPQFALFGLLIGIAYVAFAYAVAYFGGGYFVYSFLHPKPKIAPVFAIGLASSIAVFYLGIWVLSSINDSFIWLSVIISTLWLALIVQFRPSPNLS